VQYLLRTEDLEKVPSNAFCQTGIDSPSCSPGFFANNVTGQPIPHGCCPGYFCPVMLTCMIPCPLGAHCPRQDPLLVAVTVLLCPAMHAGPAPGGPPSIASNEHAVHIPSGLFNVIRFQCFQPAVRLALRLCCTRTHSLGETPACCRCQVTVMLVALVCGWCMRVSSPQQLETHCSWQLALSSCNAVRAGPLQPTLLLATWTMTCIRTSYQLRTSGAARMRTRSGPSPAAGEQTSGPSFQQACGPSMLHLNGLLFVSARAVANQVPLKWCVCIPLQHSVRAGAIIRSDCKDSHCSMLPLLPACPSCCLEPAHCCRHIPLYSLPAWHPLVALVAHYPLLLARFALLPAHRQPTS
jgi:hypothetical protein